jgi:hypothetical protein
VTEYDATNRRHIRLAEKSAKLAEAKRKEAIGGIMSNPYGREWMWDILLRCHVFSSSFVSSALTTAFAEGERNIGLQFLNDIMAYCPDHYVTMTREANERNITESVRRSQPASDSDSTDTYSGDSDSAEGDFFTERGSEV